MKIGIRAHDFGCLPPVRLAEKMAAQGVEAAQLAIPKAIAGVESYAQVTDGLLREIGAAFREHHIDIAVLGCYIGAAGYVPLGAALCGGAGGGLRRHRDDAFFRAGAGAPGGL